MPGPTLGLTSRRTVTLLVEPAPGAGHGAGESCLSPSQPPPIPPILRRPPLTPNVRRTGLSRIHAVRVAGREIFIRSNMFIAGSQAGHIGVIEGGHRGGALDRR